MKLIDITHSSLETSVMEMIMIMDSDDILTEGVMSNLLDKSGMKLTKGTSLFSYIKKAGKGIGQMFIAAIRGDKDKVKEVMKSVNKQDMMDFIMKMDTATMGLVTGPIRMIEAITGWGLTANIKVVQAAKNATKIALTTVKSNITSVVDKVKAKTYITYIMKMEKEIS